MLDRELFSRFFSARLLGRRGADLARVLGARIPGRCSPIFVQFLVTTRCNLRCLYCENPGAKIEEMSHREIMAMLDELCKAGMRKITLSGGEPLLRKELPEWITFLRQRGVFVNLISNGALLPKRIDEVAGVDLVIVSIDGPREVHEAARGAGSHAKAMDGLHACLERGVPVMTSTVISRSNVDQLDFVLDLAKEYGFTAIFSPVDAGYELARDTIPRTLLDRERLHAAFVYLLEKKRAGYKVGYPTRFLKEPGPGGQVGRHPCRWAGRLFCTILPDGRVLPCNPLQTADFPWKNGLDGGFVNAMKQMPAWGCNGCGSGTPELDSLLSFRVWEAL